MGLRRAGPRLALAATLIACPALADSRVEDGAGLVFESTEEELETRLDEIAERTGVDVYLVLARDLSGLTAGEAVRALPQWDRPGRQLVLFVAMTERQVRIEADPELATNQSDAVWARLIETTMLRDLRAGREATAVRRGLDAIEDQLTGEAATRLSTPAVTVDALRDTLFVLFTGLLGGLSFNRIRRERMWRARG